jgi:uncharacterized sporulation protein YeaH/YhbH (DUF444 family)
MRTRRIKRDERRFIDILKGKIKQDIKKYLKPGSVILPGKGKREPIKIRFFHLPLPRFRHGPNFGGVGVGGGKPGDDLGPIIGDPKYGQSEKNAGEQPGELIEVEFSEDEILEMLELELPNLQPKGEKTIDAEDHRWSSARRVGPESLIIKRGPKGIYRRALQRQLASGAYDPRNPKLIPIQEDKSFRSTKPIPRPQNNAMLAFMRDISGSVSDEEREIISYFCFFAEGLLKRQYDEIECVYIAHHVQAEEMKDQDHFLKADSYGGTKSSSAHQLLIKIVEDRFSPEDWNIYPVYFSDGMNWEADNDDTIRLIQDKILAFSNQYSYGEVQPARRSWYKREVSEGFSSPGFFGQRLESEFAGNSQVVYLALKERDDAWEGLQVFFGRKKKEA